MPVLKLSLLKTYEKRQESCHQWQTNVTHINSHKSNRVRSTHSAGELWTHSSLLSDRNTQRSLKNSSERSVKESSASSTPFTEKQISLLLVLHLMCVRKTQAERETHKAYLLSSHTPVRAADGAYLRQVSLQIHQTEMWPCSSPASTKSETFFPSMIFSKCKCAVLTYGLFCKSSKTQQHSFFVSSSTSHEKLYLCV